ncbi:DUF4174 domain-containing protein [Lichenihabitans sp. Uapishka_5]|uniref:DUF4174 domain-containing protein n=1 Tax=Lichenihabitans sp. Uapishka_5 TaxID=3037302 RepID=UPI0029E813A3|nr:DUF4174 domain-containing protein [Lichenihabitans sp. Uapishka_5]MDX7950460.1 DUF4174 domain-containing protein [Lichenihabitans sp. Uapishka_5]
MPIPDSIAALLALPLALAAAIPAAAAPDSLAAHRWTHRVVLVLTPDAADTRLAEQRAILNHMGAAARHRDLTLVAVTGDTAEAGALRRRFGLGSGFQAVLVGKDGGAKLTAAEPLRPEALLPLIDAMPMRQDEMRRRP